MSDMVDDINERHMRPWSDACTRDNISNTPLNPFIDQELLYNKHLHIDGTRVTETGFVYHKPRLELDSLQQVSFTSHIWKLEEKERDSFFMFSFQFNIFLEMMAVINILCCLFVLQMYCLLFILLMSALNGMEI